MADYYTNGAAASACTSSRWLTEEVFSLIDLVKRDEAIYNPRHKYYFCRPYVENFWREVDQKLEKNPGASLAKWTNLRISFRREYTNYLEEKVPPCWSYFDRMFFLHPYLRRKQQSSMPKSIDSQVQDALVQISSLSNRLQRERAAAVALNQITAAGGRHVSAVHPNSHQSNGEALDHYFEYLDEAEHNNSELDEIIEEEHSDRFRNIAAVHSLSSDMIKSECEDAPDDYEASDNRKEHQHETEADDDAEADDADMRHFVLNALEKRQKEQQSRLENLSRHHEDHDDDLDEVRTKRPRSEESISSTQNNYFGQSQSRLFCASTPAHASSNISFVRPTFTKPLEIVSTTTNSGSEMTNRQYLSREDSHSNNVATSSSIASSSSLVNYQHGTTAYVRQLPNHHQAQHRTLAEPTLLNSLTSNGNCVNGAEVPVSSQSSSTASQALTPVASLAPNNTPHGDLCDCKTDPDAMFLMSLLPDIQKLNGRDRGKIKIAFQNILQDFLYPD